MDPRIARMLLAAAHSHCLREVLVIAAALSVQDPRDRPLEKQQQADEAHAQFRHEESDFLGFLQLWDQMEQQRRHLSKHKFRKHCRDNFLSWTRMQEWHDIHTQLRMQLHDMGFKENEAKRATRRSIRRSSAACSAISDSAARSGTIWARATAASLSFPVPGCSRNSPSG